MSVDPDLDHAFFSASTTPSAAPTDDDLFFPTEAPSTHAGAEPAHESRHRAAPVVEIAAPAIARPDKREVKGMVQEFSLLIRLNKQNRKQRWVAALVALGVIGGLGAGWYVLHEWVASTRPASAEPVADATEAVLSTEAPRPRTVLPAEPTGPTNARKVQVKTMRENLGLAVGDDPEEAPDSPAAPTNDKPNGGAGSAKRPARPTEAKVPGSEKVTASEYRELTKDDAGKSESQIGLPGVSGAKKGAALDDGVITGLITRRMKEFARCRRDASGAQMRVVLGFTVEGAGDVAGVSVDIPGNSDEAVKACIRGIVGKWKFPPTGESKQFTKTLMLGGM